MTKLLTGRFGKGSHAPAGLKVADIAPTRAIFDTLVPLAAYYLAMKAEGQGDVKDLLVDFYQIEGQRYAIYGEDFKGVYEFVSGYLSDTEILATAMSLRS